MIDRHGPMNGGEAAVAFVDQAGKVAVFFHTEKLSCCSRVRPAESDSRRRSRPEQSA
jgi:hypothetical protein